MLPDIWSALLFLNYLALAGHFLYRYLHPEGWFIKSTVSFFLVYALTLLVLLVPLILSSTDMCLIGIAAIALALIMLVVRGELKGQGTGWVLPLFLYMASIAQEAYAAADAIALYRLLGWYLLSPLFIPILVLPTLLILRKVTPGRIKELPLSPSGYATMGLAYVVWMVARHALQILG